jgi:tetratricopeptide (TPR) repeat protein
MTMFKVFSRAGVRVPPAILAATGLLVLGVPGPAFAAPRYKKTSGEVQVSSVQTGKTKIASKAGSDEPVRPTLMAESFRAEASAKVAKLTDQAIATLKRLIKVTPDDDPEKPDFFFRLAEHYREKKTQFMFTARELDEKVYQETNPSRKVEIQSKQKAYEKAEGQWMVEAIKMYLLIAQTPQYAQFKRMDEVLFNVADMLNQAKRRDKARIFFGQLIRNYPDSRYIPDAYLSFAEFYFNEGKVDEALKLYQQVAKYPKSSIFGYSVYKQGWCYLNLKVPQKALEMFVKVIKESDKWGGTKKSKISLVQEAKKDSVRAYALVGTADKAWPFFQRIGGNYAMNMMEKLANLYYDQGKFEESVLSFRKLISLAPQSKSLCTWEYNVVKGTLSGKDKQQQVVEAKRLAQVFLAVKKRGDLKASALAECQSNASGVLRELATTWHREAQKTQNNDTYALAHYLYKEYLDSFPHEKDAYVMSYYYAELLFKLEKWTEAADAYTKVVKMDPKGKYLTDSAYAAVISWKNALNVEDEAKEVSTKKSAAAGKGKGKGKKKGKGAPEEEEAAKPIEIPEKQQKMIAAFDTYIKFVPNAPELVPIMYRKARIYYVYNHYREAIDMFAVIATKHSKHELAVYAANLLLDSLNIMHRYDELNQWVKRFLAMADLTERDPAFKKKMEELEAASERKAAEELQKTAHYKDCGERYAGIANKYQDDPRWPELLYNAALCFEAAKLIGQAINIRNTLIKVKPKETLAQKAVYMIGANYHALAWYSRAADYYESFSKQFPGEKEAPEALQNAIVFRLGLGEYDKAIEDSNLFVKNYGTRPKLASRTASINFSLGSIYETRNETDAMVKHYTKYLTKWGPHGGLDRQIQAHVKIGEVLWKDSCPGKGEWGACIKVDRVKAVRKLAQKKRKKGKKKGSAEIRTQCGPDTKMKVAVLTRAPGKAKEAQKHFALALTLFKKAAGKGVASDNKEEAERRQTDMNFAAAQARFFQAEAQFEEFLSVKFPANLDFSEANKKKKEASTKEFTKYLDEKGKKLKLTQETYQDVIKMKTAHWAIAASARIGQLFQNFADALFTAPIPKAPVPKSLTRKEDQEDFIMTFTDAYCDTLEDKANPLEEKAIEGLGTCLGKSTELSWYNEWSKLCEGELNQIKPAEYPLAAEIRAEPGYVSFKTDIAGIVRDLK